MRVPILGAENTAPSATVVNYNVITASNNSAYGTVENQRSVPVPVAFTLSEFFMSVNTAPGAGTSIEFMIMKNGAATSLSVTISGTATDAADNVNSVSFAAGDTISLRTTPTNTPATSANHWWGAIATTAAGAGQPIMGATIGNNTFTAATTYSNAMGGHSTAFYSATDVYEIYIPTSGTISNFYLQSGFSPGGAGKSWTLNLRKNNTTTSVGASIINSNTVATPDTTDSFSVVSGDKISMEFVPGGTPTARSFQYGYVFTPTTDGESIFGMANLQNPSNAAASYEQLVGIGGNSWSAETTRMNKSPAMVVTKMVAGISVAPGAGKSWQFDLRKNIANGGLSVTLSDAETYEEATGSVSFTQSNSIATRALPTGTPTAMTAKVSYVVYDSTAVPPASATNFFRFF